MSALINHGLDGHGLLVFGVPESIPTILGVPPEALAVRVRCREGQEAFVFVRTKDGVRKYRIGGFPGYWKLVELVAANLTGT